MDRARVAMIVESYWLSDQVIAEYLKLLLSRINHEDREPMFDPNFAIAFIAGLVYAKLRLDQNVSTEDMAIITNMVERIIRELILTPYLDAKAAN